MRSKVVEAFLIGVALWFAGAAIVLVCGQAWWFPPVAGAGTFLLGPPVISLLTRVHLRDVAGHRRGCAGVRLGVIVTCVQLPLDGVALMCIFELGCPPLSPAGRQAIVVSLAIGYFWLLVVPWWYGARQRHRLTGAA